jgi:DNA-binding Lrp family transcriptional regulator
LTVSARSVTKPEIRPAIRTRPSAKLDTLDVHLIREILQGRTTWTLDPNFRKSFRSMARTLKIDEDTVRNRAHRLEEIGFITDWRLHLNPHILGLDYSYIWLEVPASVPKNDLISKLKLIPDMFIIVNWYGNTLGLVFAHDSPHSFKNKLELIQRLANVSDMMIAEILWPDCTISLSDTDWRILESLQHNPRKSYVSISREVGISSRTVERRLRRMMNERALFSMIAINPKALQGTVMAELVIEHSPKDGLEIISRVAKELDDYMWHLVPLKPLQESNVQHTWFNLALPSVSKASEILDWASGQPSVRTAHVYLEEDHMIFLQNLDHYLERKLAEIGLN